MSARKARYTVACKSFEVIYGIEAVYEIHRTAAPAPTPPSWEDLTDGEREEFTLSYKE